MRNPCVTTLERLGRILARVENVTEFLFKCWQSGDDCSGEMSTHGMPLLLILFVPPFYIPKERPLCTPKERGISETAFLFQLPPEKPNFVTQFLMHALHDMEVVVLIKGMRKDHSCTFGNPTRHVGDDRTGNERKSPQSLEELCCGCTGDRVPILGLVEEEDACFDPIRREEIEDIAPFHPTLVNAENTREAELLDDCAIRNTGDGRLFPTMECLSRNMQVCNLGGDGTARSERAIRLHEEREYEITTAVSRSRRWCNGEWRRQRKNPPTGGTKNTNDAHSVNYRLFKTDVTNATEVITMLFLTNAVMVQCGHVARCGNVVSTTSLEENR